MSVSTIVKSIQNIMRQDVGVDGDAQRISQLCWMFFLKIIDDQDQELELLNDGYQSPVPVPLRWRNWAADPEGVTGEDLLDFINDDLFPQLKELPRRSGQRSEVVRSVFADVYNYMKSGYLLRQVINKINEIDFNNLADRRHFGDIYEQLLNDLQSAGNAGEYYTPRAVTSFMARMVDPRPGETLLDPACGTGGFLTCAIRHMREHYVKRTEDEMSMQVSLRAVEKKPLPHMLAVTNMLLHSVENPSFLRHDNVLARPYISWSPAERVDIVLTNPPFGGKEEDGIESNFPQHFRTRETADLFLALVIRLLKPGGRAAVVLPDGCLFGEGVKTRIKQHLMRECNLHTIVRLPNSVFRPYASIGTNLLFFEKGEPTTDVWFWEHLVPEGQKAYSMTRPIQSEHLNDCSEWWGGRDRTDRKEGDRAWKISASEIEECGYNLDFKNPNSENIDLGNPKVLLGDLNRSEVQVASVRDELKQVLTEVLLRLNAEVLLESYDRLVDDSDAVSHLRRFVLDLAVSANLVEQDPRDEPASELLKKIDIERNRITRLGRIRKKKFSSRLEDPPFSLPRTWIWSPIREVMSDRGQMIPDRPFTYIDVSAIDKKAGFVANPKVLRPDGAPSRARKIARLGDVVYSCVRPYLLNVAIIESEFDPPPIASTAFEVLNGHGLVLPRYTWMVLRSSFMIACVENRQRGQAYPAINSSDFSVLPFPIPPLPEQHRIVEKVSKLMRLCDRLEASLDATHDARNRLLECLLQDTLTSSAYKHPPAGSIEI